MTADPTFCVAPPDTSTVRPAVRRAQVLVVVPLTAVLWWYERWWSLPLPLVLSTLLQEWLFWRLATPPYRLTVSESALVIERAGHATRALPWSDLRSFSVITRQTTAGPTAVVTLAGPDGIVLAARTTQIASVPAGPFVIALDQADDALGCLAGLLRSAAPVAHQVREPLETDLAPLIAAFVARLPADALSRRAISAWHGPAPDLDLFGHYRHPPDQCVWLDGDALAVGDKRWSLDAMRVGRTVRPVTLLHHEAGDASEVTGSLPMLLLSWPGGPTLALPAPNLAVGSSEYDPMPSAVLHLNPVGACTVLADVWAQLPAGALPSGLPRALPLADQS